MIESKTMSKEQLVQLLASRSSVTSRTAETVLSNFLEIIQQRAYHGNETRLHGFGIFKPSLRKARTGRNPATGEPVEIAAKKALLFKCSPALQAMIND